MLIRLTIIPFAVLNDEEGQLIGLSEKPTYSFQINAGVYILSPEIYSKVPHEFCDITELLERELQNRKRIGVFPIHESWNDVGSPEVFRDMNKKL